MFYTNNMSHYYYYYYYVVPTSALPTNTPTTGTHTYICNILYMLTSYIYFDYI